MKDRLISVAETSQTLGVSRITTRRLIKCGLLISVRVGNRVLIPESELRRVVLHGCGKMNEPRSDPKEGIAARARGAR